MKTLGQIAYEAYCGVRQWKSFDGKPLPRWREMAIEIQAAWDVAGCAVAFRNGEKLGTDQGTEAPRPQSETLPYVLKFAERMEAKLEKNRHKGGRENWLGHHPYSLLARLKQEVAELEEALGNQSFDNITDEAADVANFAMMIADQAQQALNRYSQQP